MNFSVLKHKQFRLLWMGQGISQLGDSFYYLVFLFMVKKVTGSSLMVGYVGALETAPYLIFGAYAGVVADRIDRRAIMLFSDLGSGIALLLFAFCTFLLGSPPLWTLLVAPFLLSSVRCFFNPAKSAAIPSLVPGSLLQKANALSTGTQTIASIASLSLSAGVLSLLYAMSPEWFYCSAIALNSTSFLLSAVFIFLLPRLQPDREHAEERHPIQDFKDGLAFMASRHDLKVLTALITIFRLMVAPFFVVYLAANDKWFGGKPQTIAWLELYFSVGMLVATVAAGHFRVSGPLLWFANGLAVVGFSVLAMAFSPVYWAFAVWQVVAGLAIPPADIPVMTYLQLTVPDGFRGRVNSVRETISTGVMPIGMVLGGLLVERFGLQAGFFVMGFGMMGGCAYGILDKRFRSATMPDTPTSDEEVGVPSEA